MGSLILDPRRHSKEGRDLIETFNKKIVGQKDATNILVDIIESYKAGFSDPTKPAGNALFLGPTGSGKTATVEALCSGLFGNPRSCIKVDCGEFQMGHEIAKLVGSPPGYLGHRETHPMLTQEALSQWHTLDLKLSVVLFDEIEKASDTLWQLMLGILDKAQLTLGDNRVVNFSKVIIIMTSNLGARDMEYAVDGGLGFVSSAPEELEHSEMETIATVAAKKHFTPEFYNRIQHVAVFHTLTEGQITKVLDIELDNLQNRLLFSSKTKFFFNVLPSAKQRLLKEGYSKTYGARHLKRAIEKHIQAPLANIVASGQVGTNQVIIIGDTGGPDLEFNLMEV